MQQFFIKHKTNVSLLLTSLVIFMFAYHSGFNTLIFNHDSVARVTEPNSFAYCLASGRLLKWVLDRTLGFSTLIPQLIFVYTFIFLVINAYILCRLLELKRLVSKFAVLMINITFPITAFYWAYGNDIWQYSLYLVFASCSILALKQKKYGYSLVATLLFLYGYQAILSYATSLLILYHISECFQRTFKPTELIKNLLRLVGFAIIYYMSLIILQQLTGVGMTDYQGADSLSFITMITSIPFSLSNAYLKLFVLVSGKYPFFSYSSVYGLITYCVFIAIASPLIKPNPSLQKYYYALLLLIWPIFISSTDFITLKILPRCDWGFIPLFITPIFISEYFKPCRLKEVTLLVITIIFVILNVFQINAIMNININKNTIDLEIADTIYSDIQSLDGGAEVPNVAFCGNIRQNDYFNYSFSYPFIFTDQPFYFPGPSFYLKNESPQNEERNYYTHFQYLFLNAGHKINVVSADCTEEHNAYPTDGYIIKTASDRYEVYLS